MKNVSEDARMGFVQHPFDFSSHYSVFKLPLRSGSMKKQLDAGALTL
jgi:hypothetical protein